MDSGTRRRVQVPKAAALVADDLRRRIVHSDLSEGDALPNETELMEYYGLSRPTLREALRVLENESLIEVKRGAKGGARVRLPDVAVTARHAALLLQLQGTTLQDVIEARRIIEPAVVRMLAERRPPQAIEKLNAAHENALATVDDPMAYARAAARFHEQVIELAGNRTLTLLARIVQEISEAHNQAVLATVRRPRSSAEHANDDHAALVGHIERGEADEAFALWGDHIDRIGDLARRALGAGATIDLFASPDGSG